jgi:hypothetical protein
MAEPWLTLAAGTSGQLLDDITASRDRQRLGSALVAPLSPLCILTTDSGPAVAQTVTATTGAVNGVVTDGTKAVVPGVTVSRAGPSLIAAQTTVTDHSSAYRFSAIPAGDYTLTFVLTTRPSSPLTAPTAPLTAKPRDSVLTNA